MKTNRFALLCFFTMIAAVVIVSADLGRRVDKLESLAEQGEIE